MWSRDVASHSIVVVHLPNVSRADMAERSMASFVIRSITGWEAGLSGWYRNVDQASTHLNYCCRARFVFVMIML